MKSWLGRPVGNLRSSRNIEKRQKRRSLFESLEQRRLLTASLTHSPAYEDAGAVVFTFDAGVVTQPTTYQWYTLDHGAKNFLDYEGGASLFTLDANNQQHQFSIDLIDDDLFESDEIFYVGVREFPPTSSFDLAFVAVAILDDEETPLSRSFERFYQGGDTLHGGMAKSRHVMPDGNSISYNSLTNGQTIVDIRTHQPVDSTMPSKIDAQLTIDHVPQIIHYDVPNGTSLQRFAFIVDTATLYEGTHEWGLKLTEYDTSIGYPMAERTYTGRLANHLRTDSPFGQGWTLDSLDHLVIEQDWVSIHFSDGATGFYYRPDISATNPGTNGEGSELDRFYEYADGTFAYKYRRGGEAKFSSNGLLDYRSDHNGNKVVYHYDTNDRLIEVEQPDGRKLSVSYDANGYVETLTDHAGRTTELTIDGDGLLTQIKSPSPTGIAGQAPVTNYSYYGDDYLHTIQDPNGNTSSFQYDAYQRVSSVTDGSGVQTQIAPQIAEDLHLPGSTGFSNRVPLQAPVPYGEVDDFLARFDELGMPTEIFDPLGNLVTQMDRNSRGFLIKQTLPFYGVGSSHGDLVTEYERDNLDNVTKITHPDGTTEEWEYDTNWNVPTRWVGRSGEEVLYTIDQTTGNTLQQRSVIGQPDDFSNGETDDLVWSYFYTSAQQSSGVLPGGLLTSVVTPEGYGSPTPSLYTTQYTYGSDPLASDFARLQSVTLAPGTSLERTTSFGYDVAGNLLSVTDPEGRKAINQYDGLGRLTSSFEPIVGDLLLQDPAETIFRYDSVGNVVEIEDALGNVTAFAFDGANRLLSTTTADPDGPGGPLVPLVSTNSYDMKGRLEEVTDALGGVTTYAYDEFDRVSVVTFPDPDAAGPQSSATRTYRYDNIGRVYETENAVGAVTAIEYDIMSQIIKQTLPDPDDSGSLLPPVWQFEYDDSGRLLKEVDPMLYETQHVYDDVGRLIETKLPDPDGIGSLLRPSLFYAYDRNSNTTGVTGLNGSTTLYHYDPLNQLIKVEYPQPGGAMPASDVEYTYNLAGEVTAIEDRYEALTLFEYDTSGRLKKKTHPDPDGQGSQLSPVEEYDYSAIGQLIEYKNPEGKLTTLHYDNLGRLTSKTLPDPDGIGGVAAPTTTYTYNTLGLLASLTDASSNVTSWQYDGLGREIKEIDPLGNEKTHEYDILGQLRSTSELHDNGFGSPRVWAVEYAYDKLGRVTQEKQTDDGDDYFWNNYTYDANSRIESASSHHQYLPMPIVSVLSYDGLGRVLSESTGWNSGIFGNWGPSDTTMTLTHQYGDYGDRVGIALEVDKAGTITPDFENVYQYDDLHRMTSVVQRGQAGGAVVADKRVEFAYDLAGDFSTISRYAGQTSNPADLVAETTYARDLLGRLESITHQDSGSSVLASYLYEYNENSQVTEITASAAVGLAGTSTFSYDNTGQLTGAVHSHIADETYSYDETGNRTGGGYATDTGNRINSDGVYNYTYDARGNIVEKVRISNAPSDSYRWKYEYDFNDRLIVVYKESFDGTDFTNLEQTLYHYDAFGRRVREGVRSKLGPDKYVFYIYDGEDIVATYDQNGTITNRYLHGPAVDQILASEDASTNETLWALTDHLGSVRDLVDDSGTVENHIVYDAFGKIVSETDPTIDFISGFTGRERDEETGLNYHRARYYDPSIGRWMQEDPIAFAAGDENIHRYVGNDPVNAVDPTGLVSQEPPGGPGSPGGEADRHVNQQFESTGRTLSLDPNAAPRFARTWGRWLLGTPGDWLDRNYGGGQYGDPDLSGRILHVYSDLSTLAPLLGEGRDVVDVVVGIDAAGNRLTPTERGLTFAMILVPVVPTRWVRGPAIDIIEGVVDHAPKGTVPDKIYRGGRFNDSAAKDIRVDADGALFRDSLSNPVPKPGEPPAPVLRPGKPYIEVDTSKLPPGSVIPDNVPPGHVSVKATVEEIVEAITGGGKFPKK